LLELGKRFRAICRETKSHRELRLQLLMLETILELMDQWQPSLRPQVDTDGYARIRSAVGMASSSRKFVSIEQAAAACGLKRNALGRLFQAVMGIGFAQFALRYRLSGAANQLRCSDDPIKAVAADWGFTDDSHLHRLIRRHYGVTPLEYRRS
jgi:AraC-like DNA-binding protein